MRSRSLRLAAVILVAALGALATQVKDPFLPKPLNRAQVLVWMDFGESSARVVQLLGRAGIDFQPAADYLALLKDSGAPPELLNGLAQLKPSGTPAAYSAEQEAGFAHLAACMRRGEKRQFADAEKECEAATSLEPAVTHFALGNIYLRNQKLKPALEEFRASEKVDPGIPESHNYAGLVLAYLRDDEGAEKEYREAIRLDPDYGTPHSNLALLYLQRGDLDTAEKEARAALKIDPKSASAHNNLGGVFVKRNDLNGAASEFRKAVELDPNSVPRRINLAETLLLQKDYHGAAAEYRQAVALAPKWPQGHLKLAVVLMLAHQSDQADAECQTAGQLAPTDQQVRDICKRIRDQLAPSHPPGGAEKK